MASLLNTDRPRGILTKEDRRYLFGELDASDYDDPKNALKQRRYRIRQRFKNSLLDLILINNLLSERDQRRVFESIRESKSEEQFKHVLSEIIDLIYVNQSTLHSRAIATLGIEKAYHRNSLVDGRFNRRPYVELNIIDDHEPEEFEKELDILRYHADVERMVDTDPPNINTATIDPDTEVDLDSEPVPLMDSFGLEQSLQYEQSWDEAYKQRIEYLKELDKTDCQE